MIETIRALSVSREDFAASQGSRGEERDGLPKRWAEARPRRDLLKSTALTDAEVLVGCHVVAGLSNKEIARLTGKSEGTIKCQIGSILRKNNVPSRSRFIALYYQRLLEARGADRPAER